MISISHATSNAPGSTVEAATIGHATGISAPLRRPQAYKGRAVGALRADKARQEIDMSKGNKEAKKPKRVTPVAKTPVAGSATATPVQAQKSKPGKR